MKKIIKFVSAITILTVCLTMGASFKGEPTGETILASVSQVAPAEGISDAQYCRLFGTHLFNSVTELYE